MHPGCYMPDWLLERRLRAERSLTAAVATCYLLGVSTRRMEKVVDTLGITRPCDTIRPENRVVVSYDRFTATEQASDKSSLVPSRMTSLSARCNAASNDF